MRRPQRVGGIGLLIAGGVAGMAAHAHASLAVHFGDVYCYAATAEPRYFHSEVAPALRVLPADDDWWPGDEQVRRRRQQETLRHLAAEFVRHVAERHKIEYLISPRCELTGAGSGTKEVEGATYARDGVLVPYEANERTSTAWSPDFRTTFKQRERWLIGHHAATSNGIRLPGDSPINTGRKWA